jgi:hypothetical protein
MVPYSLPTVAIQPVAVVTTPTPKASLPGIADGGPAAPTTKPTPAVIPAGPSAAQAITSGATTACRVQTPHCVTPVVAQSAVSIMDFTPGADAAMTAGTPDARPGTTVTINISNDLQNGEQDWTFDTSNTLGDIKSLTTFDKATYRGGLIASIEFTPFGRDTGLCLQPGTRVSTLQRCNGADDQEFILIPQAPFNNEANKGYYFALWVPQAANSQHHLALDAPAHIGGNIKVQRLVSVSSGQPSTFMWNTIP